ncbi:MAG: YlbF family regulator [Clostridium sp.]|nr:YlbF family regulator [Acetatifactor muris]MCM1528152.1 YlbF family regulator [Bacteroides sp.]MCM1562751.1 YlbF family regulator [Clostridium sp.]
MNNIDRSLQLLIADILASEVYRDYKEQCDRVNARSGLKAQIDEFRTRNLELQTNGMTTFEEIDNFERQYAELRDDPLVADFLAAELAFCRMMQDINLRITEAIHFQ